jgi:hypothetical protein
VAFERFLEDPYAIARAKYVVAGVGAILTFVFATTVVLLDRRQMELNERKQRPRTLTPSQQATFIKTLEGTPRGALRMQYMSGNTETYSYAQQVYSLLSSAGYQLPPATERGLVGALKFGPPIVGVEIGSKDPDSPPALVEPLRMAFRSIGIDAQRGRTIGEGDDVIVTVGVKD